MRLRSTLFDGRSYAALPSVDLGASSGGSEAGASSESWYNDVLGGGPDVNPELYGSQKFRVYDEMAMTDPTIKALIQFWSLPIRSAVWGLEPRVPDDPVALAIRDFVAWNLGLDEELGQMDLSWSGSLGLTLTAGLKHGPAIEELVWDDVRTWHDADGDPHLVRPLARLAPRPAKHVAKVIRDRGRVKEIHQTLPGTKAMPAEKLSYIVFDPEETGRWEGSSMLRPAWAAWRMKKALQIAAGIGWDRFASGIPVVYHPDDPDAEARAKKIGEQIRQHERAFANFPSNGPGQNGRPDSAWLLELVNGAATLADPVPLLRWFTEQESEAGLAMFSRLGSSQTGSRAVGEVQIDPFYLGVQSLAQLVRRERERQVIRRIVEVNFGAEAAEKYTPKLQVTRIQAKDVIVTAQAISYLSNAGFTFTDRGAVEDVRSMLGFGKLEDAAESSGITLAALTAVLREQGLDAQTLANIVNALPPEFGIARNKVEGQGLLPAPPVRKALPPAPRANEDEQSKREMELVRRVEQLERTPPPAAPQPVEVKIDNHPPAAPAPAPVTVRFESGAIAVPEQPAPTVIVESKHPTSSNARRLEDGSTQIEHRFDTGPDG